MRRRASCLLGEKGGIIMPDIKTDAYALGIIMRRSITGNIQGRIVVWHKGSSQFVPVKKIHWEEESNKSFIEVEFPRKGTVRFDLITFAIPLLDDTL